MLPFRRSNAIQRLINAELRPRAAQTQQVVEQRQAGIGKMSRNCAGQRLSPAIEGRLEIFAVEAGQQLLGRLQNVTRLLVEMIVGIQQADPVFAPLSRHSAEVATDRGAPTGFAVVRIVIGPEEDPAHAQKSGSANAGLAEDFLHFAQLVEGEIGQARFLE